MKGSDRAVITGVLILGLAAAFWFLILGPKRQEASDVQTQVTELQGQVTEAELAAATGQEAKKDFPSNYRKLITLGKAVPVDADTPSLLTQLQTLSADANVDFRSITLSAGPTSAAPAAAPTTTTATATATATEATVSLLPIGATVGPAGLPVMPYQMEFEGGFFEIADFFGSIDGMVDSHGDKTTVDGRLLTIDGFSFAPAPAGLPRLTANVTATSYLTPADQGVTAGATASGPAAETPVTTTPETETADPAVSAAVVAN